MRVLKSYVVMTIFTEVVLAENLKSKVGVIESPFYPKAYPNSLEKQWDISAASPMRFILNLTTFNIEDSHQCKNDYLKVQRKFSFDGSRSLIQPIVCGDIEKFPNKTFGWEVVAYGIEVIFKSDISVSGKGFRIEYDAKDVESDIICKDLKQGSLFAGRISSEFLGKTSAYPANLNCSWEIRSFPGSGLQIDIKRFDVEFSGETCTADSLGIFKTGIVTGEEEHLGTFCGRRNPWSMVVTDAKSTRLTIVTDDSDNLGGFVISFHPGAPRRTVPRLNKRLTGKESGQLLGGSMSTVSETPSPSWHLRADPGFRIRINAQLEPDVSAEEVHLTFIDAPDETFIDRYSYDLSAVSVDRTSAGFHAVIKVALSDISLLSHLNITYETFNFFLTDKIQFRYLDIGDYTFVDNPDRLFRCCVYHAVAAPHGKTIAFDLRDLGYFRDFPNDEECSRAGVVVFDGGFSKSQIIGPVCETTPNRQYKLFDSFVSSSSRIYVFLYGYTNAEGRRRFNYELDPWLTTCSVRHATDTALRTPENASSLHQSLSLNVSSRHGDDGCFLLYVHPREHSEPPVEFLVEGTNVTTSLCEIWSMKNDDFNEKDNISVTLPVQKTKFSQEWTCRNDGNVTGVGMTRYRLDGHKRASWSQRLARLTVGDVGSHLCSKLPECHNQRMFVGQSCGIIIQPMEECFWYLEDASDAKPFYWTVEILFVRLNRAHPTEQCYIEVQEFIRGRQTIMATQFMSVDLNLGRLRRYRTMEPNSHMWILSNVPQALKLRYAKRYITAPMSPNRDAKNQEMPSFPCSGDSYAHDEYCYEFRRAKGGFTWKQAESACAGKGGHLVSIMNIRELDFIKQALLSPWNNDFFKVPFGLLYIGLNDIQQVGVYRWTDGNSLSLADWFHAWDKDYNILPHNPALPVNPTISQPVAERNKRCVAMAVGNVYFSTNWRKIGCSTRYPDPSYICKWSRMPDNGTVNESSGHVDNATSHFDKEPYRSPPPNAQDNLTNIAEMQTNSTLQMCLDSWTFIHGGCYSLVSEDIQLFDSTPFHEAPRLCEEIGGHIATGLPANTLLYYLDLWGTHPGDGNIWLQKETGQLGCTSFSTLQQQLDSGKDEDNSTDCVLNEGRAGFVLCQSPTVPFSTHCLEHQFRCYDGTCLHGNRVCDRIRDCLGGEDETLCAEPSDELFFPCGDGTVISVSEVCDFWPDCRNGSDETGCQHRACLIDEFRCDNNQCIPREKKCDFVYDCLDESDENACDWGVDECKGFECPGGDCQPRDRVADLVPDCPDGTQADEQSPGHQRLTYYVVEDTKYVIERDNSAWCPGRQLARRCHRDRVTCMNRANMCQYDQNEQGDILYCRDGTHLKNCERYECPGMFKCPKSYCIPWYKVCDGQWDCVGAADEVNCDQYSCPGKLKCKGTNQCVTREQVCDGRVHCKGSWSDEQFCDLLGWSCPSRCSCDGYAVDCSAANLTEIPEDLLPTTRVLLLQHNEIHPTNSSFQNFTFLLTLRLYRNGITYIPADTFLRLANLRLLDLRFNFITSLYTSIFDGLKSLVELRLDGNPLRVLPSQSFLGLDTLPVLNLSGLGITKVETKALDGLPKLQRLDLTQNKISVLETGFLPASKRIDGLYLTGNRLDGTPAEAFRQVAAKKLFTDSFRFCCYIESSHVDECYPNTDVFSSCEDLLSTVILRAIVWFLGIACVLGNTIVIVWRMYSGFRNRPSVYVLNLSVSDTLMGVYLIILASMDIFYRGNYILSDLEWRQGSVCHFLGILTTVSCEMSMFTLLVLAIDRFLTIKLPFTLAVHTVRGAWILMACLWVVSLILALIPLALANHFHNFYGKNSICMPFSFTDPKSDGWEYATVVFVGLNGLCLIVMIGLYAAIYCRVRESQMTAGRTDRSDLVVARRLSIVLVTNIVSWIPVILASIISITVGPLTREMAAILSTVVLPLNPALNPYLYTFNSCVKRDKDKQVLKKLPTLGKTSQTHL